MSDWNIVRKGKVTLGGSYLLSHLPDHSTARWDGKSFSWTLGYQVAIASGFSLDMLGTSLGEPTALHYLGFSWMDQLTVFLRDERIKYEKKVVDLEREAKKI